MSVKSLNRVMLIGNVTRDPELRYTPQGNAVSTFGLATNRSWKTDNGEIREEAEFHRLVAWNKLAELCSQLCTKGRKIYVEGRLQTRTFTGSDNAQHTITEIVIDDMILLDSRQGMGAPAPVSTGVAPVTPAEPAKTAQPAEEPAKPKKTKEKPLGTARGKAAGKGEEVSEEAKEEVKAETKDKGTEVKEEVKEDVNVDDIPF